MWRKCLGLSSGVSAFAVLVACSAPIGDGIGGGGPAVCQAICNDSVSIVADVPLTDADVDRVVVRVCKNDACTEGRPKVATRDENGFFDCGLGGGSLITRCSMFSLSITSPPVENTHRLSANIVPKDLVDGDVYRVVVERVSDGTRLFDQARPTTYETLGDCQNNVCRQANIEMLAR
jgi:hypothetical protein